MSGATTTKLLAGSGDGELSLLIITSGDPRVVPLRAGSDVTIGRADTADVVLDDASLSRLHARFRLRGDVIEVEDLDSSNGTIVRGDRLQAGKPARLTVGDGVHLGTVLVVIQRRGGSIAERLRPAAAATRRDELVARIAASTISVLILGETGVGKEVMAEAIHAGSPRRDGPLVKVNCAAFMTSVLESELFGHERGAFTGAVREKPGLIESADGGTLFLDEIGEADPAVQVKLLRVLEARETQRIGALRPRIVDVRFVAATNRVPEEQIRAKTLRADLYYRLAGFTITIPPLRERRAEIPALANELLARHSENKAVLRRDAIAQLVRHDWPGNVRELRNVIDRAVVLCDGKEITVADITAALGPAPLSPVDQRTATTVDVDARDPDPERARVLAALEECGGNQTMAAERLGMPRRTLVYRLKAWGMTRPRRR